MCCFVLRAPQYSHIKKELTVPDPHSTYPPHPPVNKRKTEIHERRDLGEKAVLGQGDTVHQGGQGQRQKGSGEPLGRLGKFLQEVYPPSLIQPP